MSDMGEGQATEAPQQETAAEPPAQTNDALMSRLDEMAAQMSKLTAPSEPEWQGGISDLPYAEGDTSQDAPFDPYQQVPGSEQYQPGQYDTGYEADPAQAQQQAMQQLQSYISEQVQQGVQQHVTPYIQQQRANELERQYPALADPKTAGEVVQQTAAYAQKLGRPELARDPQLVELVYLAQQARNSASQETPADGDQGVHLESGGAAPQAEEMDAADRMLKAWGKL